ncbi:hypothetical protein PVAG01_06244 [Phlyctema vagabunda]|uniref:Uncharacterized protein n=1 Tax=Phlyctema vagabunda TaxID=108571 RepID=A0ABR4PFI0_9HELO
MSSPQEQESQVFPPYDNGHREEFLEDAKDNRIQPESDHDYFDLIDESQLDPHQPQVPEVVFQREEVLEKRSTNKDNNESATSQKPRVRASEPERAEVAPIRPNNNVVEDGGLDDSMEQESLQTLVPETQYVGMELETQEDSNLPTDVVLGEDNHESQLSWAPYQRSELSESQKALRQMQFVPGNGSTTTGPRPEDLVDPQKSFKYSNPMKRSSGNRSSFGKGPQPPARNESSSAKILVSNYPEIPDSTTTEMAPLPVNTTTHAQTRVLRSQDINALSKKPNKGKILPGEDSQGQPRSVKQHAKAIFQQKSNKGLPQTHMAEAGNRESGHQRGSGTGREDNSVQQRSSLATGSGGGCGTHGNIERDQHQSKSLETDSVSSQDGKTSEISDSRQPIQSRPRHPEKPAKTSTGVKPSGTYSIDNIPFPSISKSAQNTHNNGTALKTRKLKLNRKPREIASGSTEMCENLLVEEERDRIHSSALTQNDSLPSILNSQSPDNYENNRPNSKQGHAMHAELRNQPSRSSNISRDRHDVTSPPEKDQIDEHENHFTDDSSRSSSRVLDRTNTPHVSDIQSKYDHGVKLDGVVSMEGNNGNNGSASRQTSELLDGGNIAEEIDSQTVNQNLSQAPNQSLPQPGIFKGQISRPLTSDQLRGDTFHQESSHHSSRIQKHRSKTPDPQLTLKRVLEMLHKSNSDNKQCMKYLEERSTRETEQNAIISDLAQKLDTKERKAASWEAKAKLSLGKVAEFQNFIAQQEELSKLKYSRQKIYIDKLKSEGREAERIGIEVAKASEAERHKLAQIMEQKIHALKKNVTAGLHQAGKEIEAVTAANQALQNDLLKTTNRLGEEQQKSRYLEEKIKDQEFQRTAMRDLFASNREVVLKEFTNSSEILSSMMKTGVDSKTAIDELIKYAKSLKLPKPMDSSILTTPLHNLTTRLETHFQRTNDANLERRKELEEIPIRVLKEISELSSELKERDHLKEAINEVTLQKLSSDSTIQARERELQHAKNLYDEQSRVLADCQSQNQQQFEKVQKLEIDLKEIQNDLRLALEYKTRLQDLETSKVALSNELNVAEKKCSELEDKIRGLQESQNASHQELENSKKNLEEANIKIKKYVQNEEDHNADRQRAVSEACAKISKDGNTQLANTKQEHDIKMKGLKQAVNNLKQESLSKDHIIDRLRAEIAQKQEEQCKVNSQILVLGAEIEKQNKKIAEYRETHQIKENELQNLRQAQLEHAQSILYFKSQAQTQQGEIEKMLQTKDGLEKSLLLAQGNIYSLEEKEKELKQIIQSHSCHREVGQDIQSSGDLEESRQETLVGSKASCEQSQAESFGSASYEPLQAESQPVSANSTRTRQLKPVTRSASLNDHATDCHEMLPPPRPERRVASRKPSSTGNVQQNLLRSHGTHQGSTVESHGDISKDMKRPLVSNNIDLSPVVAPAKPSRNTTKDKPLKSAMKKPGGDGIRRASFAPVSQKVTTSMLAGEQSTEREPKTRNEPAGASSFVRSTYNRHVSGANTAQYAKELHSPLQQNDSVQRLSPRMPLPKKNKRAGSMGSSQEQGSPFKKQRLSMSALHLSKRTVRTEIPDSQDNH